MKIRFCYPWFGKWTRIKCEPFYRYSIKPFFYVTKQYRPLEGRPFHGLYRVIGLLFGTVELEYQLTNEHGNPV